MNSQDNIFLEFEGDNWYERNKEALKTKGDSPLLLMELYNVKPNKVLEVGASNGYRLAKINEKYGCEVCAVEPSEKAISDCKVNCPSVRFQRATAETMVYNKNFFDLVIMHSVFHWIGRETLLASIANIDKVLKWGGYLIIGDFQVPFPIKRRYHHIEDRAVFTYKIDYRKIFLSTGFYKEIGTLSLNQDTKLMTGETSIENYYSVSLLRKEDMYIERE